MDAIECEKRSHVLQAEDGTSYVLVQKEEFVLEEEEFFNGVEIIIEPVFDLIPNKPDDQTTTSSFSKKEYERTHREIKTIEIMLDVTIIFIKKLLGW